MDKGNILESWKEIAAHLRRNVRTCQLWERDHGLPVHRLDGSPKARVFAYPAELDRWLHEKLHEHDRDARPNGRKSTATLPTLPAWNIGLIAGLVVLAAAAVGTSDLALRPAGQGPLGARGRAPKDRDAVPGRRIFRGL